MPRNGHSTKTAATPKDLYDTLTQPEQDAWDAIGALGYTPEQGGLTGLWFARHRVQTKITIGPSTNLVKLLAKVREDAAAEEDERSETGDESGKDLGLAGDVESFDDMVPREDSNGMTVEKQSNLPGMEEVPELDAQGDRCVDAFLKKKAAAAKAKDEDDIMRSLLIKHGRKRYTRQGYSLVVEDSQKLVIKKAEGNNPKKNRGKRKEEVDTVVEKD